MRADADRTEEAVVKGLVAVVNPCTLVGTAAAIRSAMAVVEKDLLIMVVLVLVIDWIIG